MFLFIADYFSPVLFEHAKSDEHIESIIDPAFDVLFFFVLNTKENTSVSNSSSLSSRTNCAATSLYVTLFISRTISKALWDNFLSPFSRGRERRHISPYDFLPVVCKNSARSFSGRMGVTLSSSSLKAILSSFAGVIGGRVSSWCMGGITC